MFRRLKDWLKDFNDLLSKFGKWKQALLLPSTLIFLIDQSLDTKGGSKFF